jgi:hypothetical protein
MTNIATSEQTKDIAATYDLLAHESGIVEVRAIATQFAKSSTWDGYGDIISGYFNDRTAFVKCVTDLNRSKLIKGIYATLNPVVPALIGRAENRLKAAGKKSPTTSDDDIMHRHCLLIDADPFRPAEIASTQPEMEAAKAKADEVAAYLNTNGWPEFYRGNSGNGAHLVGLIDLPNNDESSLLISDFLKFLDWKFGTVPSDNKEAKRQFNQGVINVGIDTTVYNASRISKVYGTKVCKGDNTADRPHRVAQFTHIPAQPAVIPSELIEIAVDEYRKHKTQPPKAAPKPPINTNGHSHRLPTGENWCETVEGVERWLADHGVTLGNRDTYTRDNFEYKWDVDCLTSGDAHKDGASLFWGAGKGMGYKCHHNGCNGKGWADVRAIIGPKVYTNGHAAGAQQQKTVRTVDQVTGEIIEAAAPDLALTIDEVLQAISEIATTEDIEPGERKKRIVKELAFAVGELERSDHALVIEALGMGKAGFTKSDAKEFIAGCVADAKKRSKEAQQRRSQQARANLLTVRAAKNKYSIDTGNRQLSDIVGDALQAIRDDNGTSPTTFVRGGILSRIAKDERGFYGIQEFGTGSLLAKLADVADWETVSLDENGEPKTKAVFPPRDVIAAILGAADWPGMPALSGVVNAPIFSSDGKLHDKPGYDSDTRHYYTGGVKVGNTAPIAPNIERAKDLILNNLLIDFPFKDEASRAHAVAYLLLPFVRDRIVGPTPVHTVDAPSAGTGKGLLLNACAYAFLGHEVPTMPAAKDDDEWRKRISSSLMSGNTHLVIDNVNHELDSGSLASAFTQPVWQDRVLGSNREIKIPVRCIWGITANNIKLSQELARRCIWIRLDANAEQPWGRDGFKHKFLISWVSAHRDELATAAITLIRAWIAQGQPMYSKRTKGSYESWAGVMGGILETVGIPGFLDNEAALYERVVSKSNLLIDFVKDWWDKQQARVAAYQAEVATKGESKIEKSLSSDELFKLASYAEHENDDPFGQYLNLLGDLLGDGRPRSRQIKLGRILSEHQDKVVGGYKILLAKTAKGMKYWRLEDATAAHSTQHSTQHLQVVETSQVECVEYKAPYPVCETENIISNISHTDITENKKSVLHSGPGEIYSTYSTQGTTNGTATGGSDWVECQNPHSTQTTQFTVGELIAKVDAIKGLSNAEKSVTLESEANEVTTWTL